MESPAPALLEVRGLRTLFSGERGEVRAVDGVDLQLQRGRTLGIVGESGCGKSVTALSIMGLVPQPPGRIAGGAVLLEGVDLLRLPAAELRSLRGNQLSMIFQEPMTSLDVTIQAQILDLMRALRDETGAAIMLITHDLGVIAELAQDVIVMYAGKVVERAEVATLFADPQHPYTVGLLGSIPKLHADQQLLATIEGVVPNPLDMPPGCRFNPRCPFAIDQCRASEPPLAEIKPGHFSACWRAPLEE